MTRIPPIDPTSATGATAHHLAAAKKILGGTPNMILTAAHSPATIEAMLGMFASLSGASLGPKIGEQIALAIAESNRCGYCLSAHTAIGKAHGLTPAELEGARRGVSTNPKTAAILALATEINRSRGQVNDAVIAAARLAGVSDTEIVETVGFVALNVFTNYFNIVCQTEIDFPVVQLAAAV